MYHHRLSRRLKRRFIREKVERVIRLIGFPLKSCGNDEEKQSLKVVILGLAPGIQGVFDLNTKDTTRTVRMARCKPN